MPVHTPEQVSSSSRPALIEVPETKSTPITRKSVWASQTWVLIGLGACWLLFFDELRGEWQTNAQYSFAYVMPMLTAVLVWRRWLERPETSIHKSASLVCLISAALLLLQLPLRLVVQANPEWRMIYWLHGFQAIGLTLCYVYWLGGWSWVKYFAPPLSFMLIAIPWPMGLEQTVIQGLMRFVAGLTVDMADWLSIPAIQDGNLVRIGAGVVGIDEACSGVRSLQTALMLSLFLGEMNRFSLLRRISLLGGSLLFVLVANLARTTFLVWAAANRGFHQMEAWHDTAGIVVMVIVLSGLMLLARWISPRQQRLPVRQEAHPSIFPSVPLWAGLSFVAWIGVTETITEAWYRSHEAHLVPNARWTVAWPADEPQFHKRSLPANSLAILRCSNSDSASWQDESGNRWNAFFLRWEPGRNSAQLAKGHRPEICLQAAGLRLRDDLGEVDVQVNGFYIPFRHNTFESGNGLLHVFYCLWSDYLAPNEKPTLENGTQASRLQAALNGKRNLGQQVLEISLLELDPSDDPIALLKKQLPALVKRQ
jgi:exosortase